MIIPKNQGFTRSQLRNLYNKNQFIEIRITCKHCMNEFRFNMDVIEYAEYTHNETDIDKLNLNENDKELLRCSVCKRCLSEMINNVN